MHRLSEPQFAQTRPQRAHITESIELALRWLLAAKDDLASIEGIDVFQEFFAEYCITWQATQNMEGVKLSW